MNHLLYHLFILRDIYSDLPFTGVDLTANQEEISDHETFQLEFDWSTKRWYIRTMQDKYWTLETGGGIQAAGDKRLVEQYSVHHNEIIVWSAGLRMHCLI